MQHQSFLSHIAHHICTSSHTDVHTHVTHSTQAHIHTSHTTHTHTTRHTSTSSHTPTYFKQWPRICTSDLHSSTAHLLRFLILFFLTFLPPFCTAAALAAAVTSAAVAGAAGICTFDASLHRNEITDVSIKFNRKVCRRARERERDVSVCVAWPLPSLSRNGDGRQ